MLRLDPSFGTNGIWQHDYGTTYDYITAFNTFHYRTKDANTFASIIVAGMVTSSSGEQAKFGMCRLTPLGVPDPTFGTNGIALYSWGLIDYPNSLIVPDSLTIVAAGRSSIPFENGYKLEPSLFRFKANGDPDSTFGINGRNLVFFDTGSTGEFMSVDTLQNPTRYIATGYSNYSPSSSHTGFAAIRFNYSGSIDSSFGINGKAIVPYPLHTAIGYIRPTDKKIYFIGTDTAETPEIVLCLMSPDGKPDASFGSGGIKQTGIHVAIQGKVVSAILKSSYLFAVAPIAQPISIEPFALMQFKENGDLDPQFGSIGMVPAPGNVSTMIVHGIFIANDGGHILAGSVDSGKSFCAATKFFPNGTIDPNFGKNGLIAIDALGGSADNYLINFSTIGKDESDNNHRKYLGIGGAFSAPQQNNFLVLRFDSVLKSEVPISIEDQNVAIVPNPATDFLNMRTKSIRSLSIHNSLGQSVIEYHSGEVPSLIDIRTLTNGIYYCVYESSKGKIYSRFIVRR